MALVDYFPSAAALDPTSMTLLQRADASVYDISDTSFTTPLALTDLQGVSMGTTLEASVQGFFPAFQTPGHIQVIAKSGNHQTPLVSLLGLVLSVVPNPGNAVDGQVLGAVDGTYTFVNAGGAGSDELPDPGVLPDGYVPIVSGGQWSAGPGGTGGGGDGHTLYFVYDGAGQYRDANNAIPPSSKPAGDWLIREFLTNGNENAPQPTYPTWAGVEDRWKLPEE